VFSPSIPSNAEAKEREDGCTVQNCANTESTESTRSTSGNGQSTTSMAPMPHFSSTPPASNQLYIY